MAKKQQDDEWYEANPRVLTFVVTDEDNGDVALDMSAPGWTARWAMSRIRDDGSYSRTPTLEKTFGSGVEFSNAVNGEVEVSITEADTEGLGGKTYHHELEVVNPAGQPVVVAVGTITMLLNLDNT